ncbi:MAG: peptide chain release factor 2 [Candidatus Pacebacteria bacterium CG_4_10_14_0_8_um_filter_43_12]|nr:MAG: peptide chain release factor 2 [Candidatus Pacebacteria bacterium CG10_big_fil_rev_8_21_14_0_10_44_11]PIY79451.1 MAG: peptide chain release factor 2 [Candidatus Pacebacteria bacterium CG_4_10_14_0_8_um_filter_43_12]
MDQTLIDRATEIVATGYQLSQQLDLPTLQAAHQSLEKETFVVDFWQRSDAQAVMQHIALFQEKIDGVSKLNRLLADATASQELQVVADQEENEQLLMDFESTLRKLVSLTKKLQLEEFLSGPYDKNGALFSVHSGQGGTEAMDWSEMVRRMYLRFFDQKGWQYTLIAESRGEEAGIKAAEYEVNAPYAYGYLKRERGTHRLVRQSPFNADNLRQTSFALVGVLPLIAVTDTEIKLNEADLSWNFSRAGGAGGQNVNKVNTAVELTYLPTGLVVKCREERSQTQNKERALQKLKAMLAQEAEEKRETALSTEKGVHKNASWGNQIRNYVLHPYHLVKDTRTEVETADTEGVLNGNLDEFIQAEIQQL